MCSWLSVTGQAGSSVGITARLSFRAHICEGRHAQSRRERLSHAAAHIRQFPHVPGGDWAVRPARPRQWLISAESRVSRFGESILRTCQAGRSVVLVASLAQFTWRSRSLQYRWAGYTSNISCDATLAHFTGNMRARLFIRSVINLYIYFSKTSNENLECWEFSAGSAAAIFSWLRALAAEVRTHARTQPAREREFLTKRDGTRVRSNQHEPPCGAARAQA